MDNMIIKNQFLSRKFLTRIAFCILTPFYIYYSIALHLEGSDFFTGRMPWFTGKFNFKEYSIEFSILLAVLVLTYFTFKIRKKENVNRTIVYIFLYIILIAYYYIFLSLTPLEIVHFFQYFILIFILGKSLDPQKDYYRYGMLLFISTVVSIIDELAQYYILSPGHYHIDFNDILLNCTASIGGCLIYYGFKNPPEIKLRPFYKTVRFYLSSAAVLFIFILFLTGTIVHTPPKEILPGYTISDSGITFYLERKAGKLGSWLPHAVKGQFYNMSATEGVIVILLVMAGFTSYDKRTFLFFKQPNQWYNPRGNSPKANRSAESGLFRHKRLGIIPNLLVRRNGT